MKLSTAENPPKRTLPIWTNYAMLLLVVFLPLAYKANGISDDITKDVLLVIGGLAVSTDTLGFLHRKLTEKLKLQEVADGKAPEQK